MIPASGRVHAYPASERPVYAVRGAYIHEYPHGPAVFVALGGLVYAYPGDGTAGAVPGGRAISAGRGR